MVTKWGLSSLGPLKYGEDDTNPFLGKSAAMQNKTLEVKLPIRLMLKLKRLLMTLTKRPQKY